MPTRRQFVTLFAPLLATCAGHPGVSNASGQPSSAAASKTTPPSANACSWPAWIAFRDKFIQADGRVIDFLANSHSTSEGQVYGLFFALVANDRSSFERILDWARANLAGGDLTARLMAWQWGKKSDGSWGVLDANAASDADLWLSYILYQAGHIWQDAKLRASAELLQARIEKELIINVPGLGPVLLPGPQGFALKSGGWKLNPSYLPFQVLAGLQHEVPRGPWKALAQNTMRMLDAVTPQMLVADWVAWRPQQGFVLDKEVGVNGSYDAIRTYLWAGMLSRHDPWRSKLLGRMKGMLTLVEKNAVPPHKLDASNGNLSDGAGPLGFSAALLPFLAANDASAALEKQKLRITAGGGVPQIYYEQALALFALGFIEQRFHFARNGKLMIPKQANCQT
ncbi:MAG: hypothetical protein RL748_2628 [Pseudomonadota bacterium]|jgi:endoglucanase